MTKIVYRISAPIRTNLPLSANSGAELDRILADYYQLGGKVGDLGIHPVVKLGAVASDLTVGLRVELSAAGTQDHVGRILAIQGSSATVSWDSGVKTTVLLADLREARK